MTKPDNLLISEAKRVLKLREKAKARELAKKSTQEYPEDVDGWLILAGLSSPQDRSEFLRIAKALSPDNPRVEQAIIWASKDSENSYEEKNISVQVEDPLKAILSIINKVHNKSLR